MGGERVRVAAVFLKDGGWGKWLDSGGCVVCVKWFRTSNAI